VNGFEHKSPAIVSQDSIGDGRASDAKRSKMLDTKKAGGSPARNPNLYPAYARERGRIGCGGRQVGDAVTRAKNDPLLEPGPGN
jgi:hypothetical protein